MRICYPIKHWKSMRKSTPTSVTKMCCCWLNCKAIDTKFYQYIKKYVCISSNEQLLRYIEVLSHAGLEAQLPRAFVMCRWELSPQRIYGHRRLADLSVMSQTVLLLSGDLWKFVLAYIQSEFEVYRWRNSIFNLNYSNDCYIPTS